MSTKDDQHKHLSAGRKCHYVSLVLLVFCYPGLPVAISDEFPEFLEQPESQTVSHLTPVTLRCAASPGHAHIRWLFDGQPLDKRRHRNLEMLGSDLHFPYMQQSGAEEESSEGEYRCTATTSMGTVISQPAMLSTPEISRFTPMDDVAVTVTQGGYVTLTCEPPRSFPPAVVAFQRSTGELLTANEDSILQLPSGNLILTNLTTATTTDYRCVALNPVSGHNRTSPWTISVTVSPAVPGVASSAHIMPGMRRKVQAEIGSEVVLECPTYGDKMTNVSWSKFGGSLPTGRYSLLDWGNLKIHTTQYEDSGTFKCSTDTDHKLEGQVYLEIITPPVIQVVKKPEGTVEVGSRVEMACAVAGFPKPDVQWFHNGHELTHKDEGSLILTMVSPADSGIYQCMATNKLGTAYGAMRLRVGGQHKTGSTIPVSDTDDEDAGLSSGHGSLEVERPAPVSKQKSSKPKLVILTEKHKKKKNGSSSWGDHEKPKYAPSIPTVTQLSDRTVLLNWSVPDKSNGQTIKFFKVQYKEMSPEKGAWRTSDAHLTYSTRRFEVSHLKSGASYKFRILAVYEDNDNKNSANTPIFRLSSQLHAPVRAPDTAPTIVEAKPIVFQQNYGIGVKWQHKSESSSIVEGFIIFYKPFGASEDKEKVIPGAGIRNDVIRGLEPNTPYNIRMQLFNSAGRSQFSNQVVVTTKSKESLPEEDYPEPELPELPEKEPIEHTEAPLADRRSSETLEQPVILGVVLGGLILALVILVTMCWWKQRQQKRNGLTGGSQHKFQDQSQCIFADHSQKIKQNGGLYQTAGNVLMSNGHGPPVAGSHSSVNAKVSPHVDYDTQATLPMEGTQKLFYGHTVNEPVTSFSRENSSDDKCLHSGGTYQDCHSIGGADVPIHDLQKSAHSIQQRMLPLTPGQPIHSHYSDTSSSQSPSVQHEYSEPGDHPNLPPGVLYSLGQSSHGHHRGRHWPNSGDHCCQDRPNLSQDWPNIGQNRPNFGHERPNLNHERPNLSLDRSYASPWERQFPSLYSSAASESFSGQPSLTQSYGDKLLQSHCDKLLQPHSEKLIQYHSDRLTQHHGDKCLQACGVPPAVSRSHLPQHSGSGCKNLGSNNFSAKHRRRKRQPRSAGQDERHQEQVMKDQGTNTDHSSNEGTFEPAGCYSSESGSDSGSELEARNCDSSFANNGSWESLDGAVGEDANHMLDYRVVNQCSV